MFELEKTVKYIKGAIKEPEPTWDEYISENYDWKTTAVLITLPLVIVSMLVNFLITKFFFGSELMGEIYSSELLLKAIVFAVAGYLILAYIVAFFSSKFGGEEDYDKSFAAVSLCAAPAALGSAISSIPVLGWIISIVLSVYTLILFYRSMPVFLKVPENKRIIHFIVSIICWLIAAGIIGSVFGLTALGTGNI